MENFRAYPLTNPEQTGSSGFGRRMLREILETVVLSVVLFLGINLITARIRVESVSMYPTLNPGEYVIVNKLSGWVGAIERGDVIVFELPSDPEQRFIKRVIGLPSEQVRISEGRVFIDGQALDEPYLQGLAGFSGVWQVSADSYFVMGDNRNNSSDSRSWGGVPVELVIGEALLVYWPPSSWGLLNARAFPAQPP